MFKREYLTITKVMAVSKKRKIEAVEPEDGLAVTVQANGVVNGILAEGLVAREEPKAKKQQQRRSLFVRSLPAAATTESLIEHFSQSYPIKHATAVIDASTKQCKGYGFITFADAEDAVRALADFNGSTLQGRKIKLEIAEPRSRDVDETAPIGVRGKSVPSAAAVAAKARRQQVEQESQRPPKLIIRNLPWSIKKPAQLEHLFRSYGKVKHATLPSKKPGLLSGFGFIVMRGKQNAEKALAGVNGKEIDGRTLAVDWAVERDEWQGQQGTVRDNEIINDEAIAAEGSDGSSVGSMAENELEVLDSAGYESDKDEDDDNSDDEGSLGELDDLEADEADTHLQPQRPDYNASTLFIRNLPFTSTDETVLEHFEQFGALRYARVVLDRNTERPKGTAFVCFINKDDAIECHRNAPSQTMPVTGAKKAGSMTSNLTHSVLQNASVDPEGKFTIDGRVLQVSRAVDKSEANRLTEDGVSHRNERDKDKRRLYLLSEGTISTGSQLYQSLAPAEISMREASLKQRKALIQSNPSLHLSLTRLSIRNIPRSITSKDLKALAREGVVEFAKDVKAGKRQRLSKEEVVRGGNAMVEAEKLRKLKGKGIVKQAKVVFEGREGGKVAESTGAGRSRGYGFIEYYNHRSALMGLRWLNGHAVGYQAKAAAGVKARREDLSERKKRLIVEFAIENVQVVSRRSDREDKARERSKHDEGWEGIDEGGDKRSARPTYKERHARGKKDGGKGKRFDRRSKPGSMAPAPGAHTMTAKEDEKQATRTRIIAKKRSLRREKRKTTRLGT